MLARLAASGHAPDAIILSDYAKGVLSPALIESLDATACGARSAQSSSIRSIETSLALSRRDCDHAEPA